MNKPHLYFAFIFALSISCDSYEKHPDRQAQTSAFTHKIDSTAIEELVSAKQFYERFNIVKNLPGNYERIDSNTMYDSLQIRFWKVGGLYMNRELYILKYNLNKWSIQFALIAYNKLGSLFRDYKNLM